MNGHLLREAVVEAARDVGAFARGAAEEGDALGVLLEVVVRLAELGLEGHGAAGERAEVGCEDAQRHKACYRVPAPPQQVLLALSSYNQEAR